MTTRLLEAKAGDSLASATAALYAAWRNAVRLERASANDLWAGFAAAGGGGFHRYGFAVNMVEGGVGSTTTYVLDTSMDWRDRICLVRGMPGAGAVANLSVFPGSGDDDEFNNPFGTTASSGSLSGWKLWYSNAGVASGTATGNGQCQLMGDANVLLYARNTDGALCLDFKEASPYVVFSSGVFVVAGDQTGERSTPAYSVGLPAPADFDLVKPGDLNWLQDHGAHDQFRSDLDDPAGALDSWPLGRVTSGNPAVPEEFAVRSKQRRQSPEGGAFRYHQGLHVSGGVTLVDDAIDWRDRCVHVVMRWSVDDIRPGGANEADHNTADYAQGTFYSGDGSLSGGLPKYHLIIDTDLQVVVQDGALHIYNVTGDDFYLTMMIEATPQLGPRSR